MDLFETIKNRSSIRNFKKTDVNENDLEKLLEAARWAPSAGNVQPWEFVIVRKKENKLALSNAALGQKDVEEASVVIVVCADEKRAAESYGVRGKTLYCIQDTAAAIQNMLLAAHALGLGSCWVGAFKESEVKKVIRAPQEMRPIALVPIGYPNKQPSKRERRPVKEIIHQEMF